MRFTGTFPYSLLLVTERQRRECYGIDDLRFVEDETDTAII